MGIIKIVGIVIGSIVELILLLFGFIKLMTLLSDKGAERKGRKYCIERGYEFKKVEAYPNHYGLFLKKDNMHIYASFHYERDGSFTWIKGSPEEKIEARLKKKSDKKKKNKALQ
ncbi:hypothetical protein [Echinicola shivajiensis]|uniref:hypothetical protein n=1 Tax=Echinicola shivajiensis TaxID=1035916 RepID=UPI001BFCB6B5|nr:hypothetical protein [Echinicola shivajiensis]